ncbi:MAG: hypothetical protein NO475_03725 [Candidatus Methanomethylicia archaeon]|nr:hypothetical protein [Candidatus Methanomethylicia archaeon]
MRNVIFNENALRFLKSKVSRSQYRDLWDKDLVVLVNMNDSIYGLINNKVKNMLVYMFWAYLLAYLSDSVTDFINTGGAWNFRGYPLRSNLEVNASSAYVVFGTRTDEPAFDQYSLLGRNTALEGSAITPAIILEADKRRLRFGRVSAGAVSEVGLYQVVYDTYPYTHEIMLGRTVYSVPGSGYNVYYDVIVKAPFLDNLAYYLFGLLSDTNQNLKRRDGTVVTARTSGDANASTLYLFIGTSNTPFSFDQYDLTNALALTSVHYFTWSRSTYVMIILSGAVRLATSMTIGEVGFAQRIADIGGYLNEVLLGRIPLSTPISKSAGDVFSTVITFYAGK